MESRVTERQFITFTLDKATFGIDIKKVKEIITFQEPTKLPGSSEDYMEGIINLRGRVIPIVNLSKVLNFLGSGITNTSRIIVLEENSSIFGILVDKVNGVLNVTEEAIDTENISNGSLSSMYIDGIAKTDGELILILNLTMVNIESAPAC